VRDERSKLLRSIRPMTPDEVRQNTVAGQYGPARIGGQDVPGFRQEPGVDPQSPTNTYAAVTLFVDNWRWAGVPFYVRTGKRLAKRVTEIAIQFNPAPLHIFDQDGAESAPNLLIVRIQPEEGHFAEVPVQAAGLGNDAAAGVDGFQLRVEFRRALAFGIRDAAARRHHRRRHVVHAAGHGGGELERGRADSKRVARNQIRFPELRGGNVGTGGADEMLARRGHAWRKP
jgi:glucose-6-phosphate 1-dehydrogenase